MGLDEGWEIGRKGEGEEERQEESEEEPVKSCRVSIMDTKVGS